MYQVRISSVKNITHNVLCVVTEKPYGYNFTPGQATEISLNMEGWEDEKRPYTFTSLPEDDHLEFVMKTYPERNGFTNQLLLLKAGDILNLHEVFGGITYKGEGIFIAGGAGITPFISIFRYLRSKNQTGNNKLIFSNKTRADIILENEFRLQLADNFTNILSEELVPGYANGIITAEFLKTISVLTDKLIYLCGPPPMVDSLIPQLKEEGVYDSSVVRELF